MNVNETYGNIYEGYSACTFSNCNIPKVGLIYLDSHFSMSIHVMPK